MADKKNIAARVRERIEAPVIKSGYRIWDVSYYKEGPEMILEVSIDSDNGISINDCSEVTKIIEPIIDELDPIEESYCLQVSSAGTVRPLDREEHIKFACEGRMNVTVGLYSAIDGKKEFNGVIDDYDNEGIVLVSEGKRREFTKKQISKITAVFDKNETEDAGENGEDNKE